MTWTENDFSSSFKSMRGHFSDIGSFNKRSSSREDSSSVHNKSFESRNYIQHLISGSYEPKLGPLGELVKMQKNNGGSSAKYSLKRSQSSNAGCCVASDFRPACLKSQNLETIPSSCNFQGKLEEREGGICSESSKGSYQDDAVSTNSDSSPLIPLNVPSCHEAHENETFLSSSSTSSASSLASSFLPDEGHKVMVNIDSLSICDEDGDIPPRISKMNEMEKKKTKSNVKTLYNIKTCSESDNKEMNAAIQIAQNASSCLGANKKSVQSKTGCGKLSLFKTSHHREDRKTFSEDIKSLQDYRSTPNEQLTYNELISKPAPLLDAGLVRSIQRERVHSLGHPKVRQHSSLSESENLLNSFSDRLDRRDCLVTSRSDGTEVHHLDDKLKLFVDMCPERIPTCRHKSEPSGVGLNHSSERTVTMSCRSLPTSLEFNSRTNLLERQVSTPLPGTSISLLSELDESECCPPLPTKGGSRSNLSTCISLKNRSPVRSPVLPCHLPPLNRDVASPNHANQMPPPLFSHETTANHKGAIHTGHTHLPQDPSHPPPIPSRTFSNGTNSQKGPPLPPKSVVHHFLLRKQTPTYHRPNSQESDNVEEISSSSESSNFTSSVDSEGLEQYSESCICRQIANAHDITVKSSPGNLPLCLGNQDHSSLPLTHEQKLVERAHAPMPGRYETSDSLVYDYIGNPSLNLECQYLADKVGILKNNFPEVSTNDIECALIENNYSVEKAIEHLTLKNALSPTTYSSDTTARLMASHRHRFVPDPMEA